MKKGILRKFMFLSGLFLLLLSGNETPVCAAGEYQYMAADGTEYTYNASGVLTAVSGASGAIDLCEVAEDAGQHGIVLNSIGQMVFMEMPVTSVNLPASIQVIEESAFWGCNALEEVTYEEGCALGTIGSRAFRSDEVLTDFHQKGTEASGVFDLPEGLKTIGGDAFSGTMPEEIRIPSTLTTFGGGAASYCGVLTTVTFAKRDGGKKLRIGEGAFCDSGLRAITIPPEVTQIATAAFLRCHDLTEVYLPETIEFISEGAFQETGLTEILIPAGCKTIQKDAVPMGTVIYGKEGSAAQSYAQENGLSFRVMADGTEAAESTEEQMEEKPTAGSTEEWSEEKLTEEPTEEKPTAGSTEERTGEKSTAGSTEEPTEEKPPTERTEEKPAIEQTEKSAVMDEEKSDGLKKGAKVTVGGAVYRVTGKETVAFLKPKRKSIKKLVIPDTVQAGSVEYRVTEVAQKACYGLKKLKRVKVGKYVRVIRKQAFQNCKSLKTVMFGRYLKSVGKNCFNGDSRLVMMDMRVCIDFKKAGKRCLPLPKQRQAKFTIKVPAGYEKEFRKIFSRI